MKTALLLFLAAVATLAVNQHPEAGTTENTTPYQVAQHNSSTGLLVRKKRFVVITLAVIGLIASTTATTITAIDQETDSEAFYPSIGAHKHNIRYYARKIQEKVPRLQIQLSGLSDALGTAQDTDRNMKHWLTTMSKVKNYTDVHNLQLANSDDLIIPSAVMNQMPLFNKLMMPVNYAFVGLHTYSTVQTVSSAVAGTLSSTSAVLAGIGGALAVVVSGVSIGFTLQNGADKRDNYRELADSYEAQYARLEEAERNLTQLWSNFRTFMRDIQARVETIVVEDLRTTCSLGVHGEAVPDLVKALDANWVTILNGFIHLDEKYRQIKEQIDIQLDFGTSAVQTFFSVYRNYRGQSSFIIEAMHQAGFDRMTFGRWGPWITKTPCRETNCGVRMKTNKRGCLTGTCIGNRFQKVVCSVNNQDEERCDAMSNSTLPNSINTRAFSHYSTVIKHICGLSSDYVQYQGMMDAFTVRPTATVDRPQAITW